MTDRISPTLSGRKGRNGGVIMMRLLTSTVGVLLALNAWEPVASARRQIPLPNSNPLAICGVFTVGCQEIRLRADKLALRPYWAVNFDQSQCQSCCDICFVECQICKETAAVAFMSQQLACITGVCLTEGFDSPECIICLSVALAIYFIELDICEDRYRACASRCSLNHAGCSCGPSC